MRKYWIDYLRVIAILAVITIHVTTYYYVRFGEISRLDWWIANILNSASRFSVPVFISISGLLYLGNKISIEQFYRKRAVRLVPPFVFWNIFYYVSANGFNNSISLLNTMIADGKTATHLWYLSVFICLMIFVPFINMPFSGQSFKKKNIALLIVILLCFTSYKQIASFIYELRGIDITWYKIFPWYFSYFIMGYFVNQYGKDYKISSLTIILALLSVISLGSLLNYYFALKFGIIKDIFVLNNISPIVFIITAMILLLFKKNEERFSKSNIVLSISDASFGIYLIHPFYLNITRALLSRYEVNIVTSMLVSVPIVFIISLITIQIIRRIKYIRAIC